MRVAIHQPNFCPWTPFFVKMACSDKFIILSHCQFEKGGYQNRYNTSSGKWVTMPVQNGLDIISKKEYTNGIGLLEHNLEFITWMANTLEIQVEIVPDILTTSRGTQRLIDNINHYGGTSYITNPDAFKKYLNKEAFVQAGIDIEALSVPKHLQIPIFEALEKFGIMGLRKQIHKLVWETYERS